MNGNAGYKIPAKKYQVGVSQIERRISNYIHFGDEGFMRSRNKREYSVEFKLGAITRDEKSECSYGQLALELGLMNPSIIAKWRCQYREECIEQPMPTLPPHLPLRSRMGSQMTAYQAMVEEHHIFQSMSRKGNCSDNVPMENFFSVLKREIYDGYVKGSR